MTNLLESSNVRTIIDNSFHTLEWDPATLRSIMRKWAMKHPEILATSPYKLARANGDISQKQYNLLQTQWVVRKFLVGSYKHDKHNWVISKCVTLEG